MADAAKRLAGPTSPAVTTATTIYTVPASTTAIVRGLLVTNTSLFQPTFTMSVGTDAAGTRIFASVGLAIGEAFDWTGFLVLTAAEILQFTTNTASALTVTVSGIEVT